MHIQPALNHINILTHDKSKLIEFYQRVLGFKLGPRPPFPVPGAWLYLGSEALIHLVETQEPIFRERSAIGHFAFVGNDLRGFLQHLRDNKVPYNVRIAPEIGLRQVEALDPDGNMFEILFSGDGVESVDISPLNWTGRS